MVTDKYSGYFDFSSAHNGGGGLFTSQQAVPINTVQNSKEYFEKWIKYLKLKKNKMVEIQDGKYSSGLHTKKNCTPHMFGCPLYIHNTKKACFVRLRGCPYASIYLDAPICLNAPHMPPCMFGCPCMLGCPLYALTPPYVQMPPICLDDVWMPPVHTQHKERMLCQIKGVYIWPHTFGCPLYIHNTKKACFVRLRGCPCAPHTF